MTDKIIVFSIGNPGPMTRHSCGHLGLKHLADHYNAKQLVKSSVYSMTSVNNLILVKSNAYMNESDKALKKFFDQNKLRPDQATVVIVFDDFEANLGKVKLSQFKKNESHNGIKSIQKAYKDYDFYKLGMGIGPKPNSATKDTMASWVLSGFRQAEKEELEAVTMPLVSEYMDYILEVEGDIADCNKVNAYFARPH